MKPNIQNESAIYRQQANQIIIQVTTNMLNGSMDHINPNQIESIFVKLFPNQTDNKYLDKNSIDTFLYAIIVDFLRNKSLLKILQIKEQLTYLNDNDENIYTLPFIKQHLPTILTSLNENKNEMQKPHLMQTENIFEQTDKGTNNNQHNIITPLEIDDLLIQTIQLKSSISCQDELDDITQQINYETNSDTFGTNTSASASASEEQIIHQMKQQMSIYIDEKYILLITMLPKKLLQNDEMLSQFITKSFNKYFPREYQVLQSELMVVFGTQINNISSTELEKRMCISLRDLGFGFLIVKLIKYSLKYLIPPISNTNKIYSLVLDIDHTLINVRRWIDEIQINDKLLYKNKLCVVIKIKKKIIFDNKNHDERNAKIICFDKDNPLVLYEGDEYNKCYVIRLIKTRQVVICNENGKIIKITISDEDLIKDLRYCNNIRDNKFIKPDLIYDNLYLVRFRNGLHEFFNKIIRYNNLEIILWTASVGNVYTDLMRQVQLKLLYQIGLPLTAELWDVMLSREHCTECEYGYFKDLLRLGRKCDKLIIVDNSTFSFQNFECNLLPINNYYGCINDKELYKLIHVLDEIFLYDNDINIQIELHALALKYNFSSFKLKEMRKQMCFKHNQEKETLQETKKQEHETGKSLLLSALQKQNKKLNGNEEELLQDVKNKLNSETKQIEK
eukprot:15733_1